MFKLSKFMRRFALIACCGILVSACSSAKFAAHTSKRIQNAMGVPGHGTYKVGKPYEIVGIWYYPSVDYDYLETGIASWYGTKFHNKKTANGDTYDMNDLTAAHRTLPMPSFVRVTNLENGRSLILRINDRGPYSNNRIIDISRRGSQLLGFMEQGTARVRVQILAKESRDIASRMPDGPNLSTQNVPIKVSSMPKPTVSSQSLPMPRGAKAAAPQKITPVTYKPPPKSALNGSSSVPFKDPTKAGVSTVPVSATRIFIQAGAFARYGNASRSRTLLSKLGTASISQVLIKGRDLFRVRIGPLAEVSKADKMLEWVIQSGFKDAKIIID